MLYSFNVEAGFDSEFQNNPSLKLFEKVHFAPDTMPLIMCLNLSGTAIRSIYSQITFFKAHES